MMVSMSGSQMQRPVQFGHKKSMALDSPQLVRTAQKDEPEQIHLALAGADGMTVSWVTGTPLSS